MCTSVINHTLDLTDLICGGTVEGIHSCWVSKPPVKQTYMHEGYGTSVRKQNTGSHTAGRHTCPVTHSVRGTLFRSQLISDWAINFNVCITFP